MARAIAAVFSFLILVLANASGATARTVTDMEGSKVDVPDHMTRFFGAGPPDQVLIYAMDPKLLVAQASAFNRRGQPFLDKDFMQLPVVEGFLRGAVVNIEGLAKLRPDVVLLWNETVDNDNFRRTMARAHIPVLLTRHRTYDDIIAEFLFIGQLSGENDRARTLANYATDARQQINDAVATLKPSEKLTVYLAESNDGLLTRCDNSTHGEIIKLAGARMIPECKAQAAYVNAQMSLEQLIADNPDVIIASEAPFVRDTIKTPQWRQLKAVREGRVYLIPSLPFNWITHPPSVMRIIGAKWMASVLYPTRYKRDMVKDTQEFYRLFLKTDITDAQARDILQGH